MFVKGFSGNECPLVLPGQGGGQDGEHHWEPRGPSGKIMSRGQEPGWFLGSGGTTSSLGPSGTGSSLYETHGLPLDLKSSGNF